MAGCGSGHRRRDRRFKRAHHWYLDRRVSEKHPHREELLQEARSLQSGGKVREARAVEGRAHQVDPLVGALDSDLLFESQLVSQEPRGH